MALAHRSLAWAALALATPVAPAPVPADQARLAAEARRVTITRDDWGVAHVHGHSDADAVFGMMYAQAEDDFPRIERNYLVALGRTAEADGEGAIWADLRQRLFVDPAALERDYAASPAWLRALMDAWADGLNFYLATHPAVRARVLARFEPWMALSFTEGSIGGDIERVDLGQLRAFYERGESVARIADDHLVEEGGGAADDVEVAVRDGVELAREHADLGRPRVGHAVEVTLPTVPRANGRARAGDTSSAGERR
jgi:acyl-homoserine-lactone acylase